MGQACCTDTVDNFTYGHAKTKTLQLRVSTNRNAHLHLTPAKIPQLPHIL